MASVKDQLILRCIRSLECMKNGSKDERPKTLQKLINALQNDRRVLYVSSILNILFTSDISIEICQVESVAKDDGELDREIATLAYQTAEERGRKVCVLPCDSNLHSEVAAQIKIWYKEKNSLVDPDDSVAKLANACSIGCEIEPEQLLGELVRFGFVNTDKNLVTYSLPDQLALEELKNAMDKWDQQIKNNLCESSAKNYYGFTQVIIEANTYLQNKTASAISLYCEDQFGKKYNLYKNTRIPSANGMPHMIKGLSMEETDTAPMEEEPVIEIPQELPNISGSILPLGLQAEVAHALLFLGGICGGPTVNDALPTGWQELVQLVRSICDVTYIVSPKYILPDVSIKEKFSDIYKEDFTITVHISNRVTKETFSFQDTSKLAAILSFPSKEKQEKPMQRIYPRRLFSGSLARREPMDTSPSSNGNNGVFQDFQQYLLTNSKIVAQRNRSIVVLNDPDAETRCREKLVKWCESVRANPGTIVSYEDISQKIINLSYEDANIPSESLIKYLTEVGYLEINGDAVVYKTNFTRPKDDENRDANNVFLERWKKDYKKSESERPVSFQRKRPLARTISHGSKRQKIVKI